MGIKSLAVVIVAVRYSYQASNKKRIWITYKTAATKKKPNLEHFTTMFFLLSPIPPISASNTACMSRMNVKIRENIRSAVTASVTWPGTLTRWLRHLAPLGLGDNVLLIMRAGPRYTHVLHACEIAVYRSEIAAADEALARSTAAS